jgi:hypothetical protein
MTCTSLQSLIRPGFLLTVAAGVLLTAACASDDAGAPFLDSITEANLRSDLFALSADSMAGRLVGSPELDQASDWIRDRFASLELKPAGDDGTYDQRFDLVWFSLGTTNRLTVTGAGGTRAPGNGWTPSSAGGSGRANGAVAFAGFGIIEPRLGFDDYRTGSVAGKIVLILEREPGVDDPGSPFDGIVTAEASRATRKVMWAQEHGAIGVLFVQDVQNRDDIADWADYHTASWPAERRRIERFTLSDWVAPITIPAAQVSVALAERLVAGSGRTLAELAADAEAATTGLGVVDLPGARADVTTTVVRNITPGRNILGMIEGSDPTLVNEVVIIGAHHDHNGSDGESVFNGADDDGSGTVGVMSVAGAYARAAREGRRPRRTVMFAIWDAEERGLLGAWQYTLRPLFPLPRTVANLNLDMIGRHEEVPADGGGRFRGLEVQSADMNANAINILGSTRTPELAAAVEAANQETALTLRMRYDNNASNLLRRSDHWPFLQNDVPALWFHTGLHPDYHTPNDDADRIEYEKMTRIVRLVHQTSWDLANADGRPAMEGMGSRPPN